MDITINDIPVSIKRKSIKNMNLRIQDQGDVFLSAPKNLPLSDIYNYLYKKLSWIKKHRERLKDYAQKSSLENLQAEGLFFQGSYYEIIIKESLGNEFVNLINNQIYFFLRPGFTEFHKKSFMKKWYQEQLKEILPSLVAHWQAIIGVTVNQIKIRDMKSLWGSCHYTKKCITINLKLIEKPLISLEYVIVHELVHLLEPSHNHRFYRLMDYYLPDWKNIKKKLDSRE